MKLRYRIEHHTRFVQVGEPIYGPGNQTAEQRYTKRILQYQDNNNSDWVDVPEIDCDMVE